MWPVRVAQAHSFLLSCGLSLVFALVFAGPARADLGAAKAEANPEKRAEKLLDNAVSALKSAEDAYKVKGDLGAANTSLREVSDSVEMAYDSLKETRKNPSKSPKHFKRAEIRTRELMRQLGDFREQMSFDDRDVVDKVRAAVQKVHESLLEGIMGGKKI
jgi:hypothetical protein